MLESKEKQEDNPKGKRFKACKAPDTWVNTEFKDKKST